MRFSLNFIKEFFNPRLSAQQLAHLLTMIGIEVEHTERLGDDWVFDIEVTTNRYDWLSLIGIAREIASACGKKITLAPPKKLKNPPFHDIDIVIENKDDCMLYVARAVRDIKVKPAPAWLRQRVEHCGISSVNNVVDITNYCMLKWGNPLHAFDLDKIEGAIIIRRAKNNEAFLGLDGKERVLSPDNLVIADAKKVIALAGVIGAQNTEVEPSTQRVLLEAALFSPLTVRRSRRAIVETESSYRFERRVFANYVERASRDAAEMMVSHAGGRISGYKVKGSAPRASKKKIVFSFSKLNKYLGENIPQAKTEKILKNLEFSVSKKTKDTIQISPPAFRLDIEREVDVYEEVARIYGYDNISSQLPFIARDTPGGLYTFKNALRNFLVSMGLHEMMTFSITGEEVLGALQEKDFIKLSNPLRKQENVLRTTILPGALEVVRYNINQQAAQLNLFEIADIYTRKDGSFHEIPALAITLSGKDNRALYLKGLIEALLQFVNIGTYTIIEKPRNNFTNALVLRADKTEIGFLGKLDNKARDDFDIREDVYFAQLDIALLAGLRREKLFTSFSRYPSVARDISLALQKDRMFKEVQKIITEKASLYLKDIETIEIYKGKNLPDDFYGLTIRVHYQSREKTLTAQEVDSIHQDIRETLAQKEGIILR